MDLVYFYRGSDVKIEALCKVDDNKTSYSSLTHISSPLVCLDSSLSGIMMYLEDVSEIARLLSFRRSIHLGAK